MNYDISLKGLVQLAGLEGISQRKYLDSVGVQTIGIGATVSDIPDIKSWPWNKELSLEEVLDLYRKSLKKYVTAVNNVLHVEIEQHQFDALVSICYNIGTGGLARSTFMKRINSGMSDYSIESAIMLWNKPREIIGRRQKEANLYVSGIYSERGKVNVFPVNTTTHKPIYSKGKTIDLLAYLDNNKPKEEATINTKQPSLTFWEVLKSIFGFNK